MLCYGWTPSPNQQTKILLHVFKTHGASWPWPWWTVCQLALHGDSICLPSSLYRICWALVWQWSHDYKSWANSEHQNVITNPENYWGSTTRPCVIGVWCSTELGDMSWLQNPFLESVKHVSTRSRMTDLCLYRHAGWFSCTKQRLTQFHTFRCTTTNVMNGRGKTGPDVFSGQFSMNIFKVSVLPWLLFCNFTAHGVQTWWE